MAKWTGTWAAGRTRLGRDGETVWVIEKAKGPKRYSITLKVHSEEDALAEWRLFERDPVAYAAADVAPAAAGVVPAFRADLLLKFAAHKTDADNDKHVTRAHARELIKYLRHWEPHLAGRDLRTVTLAEYQAIADTLKPRRQHIIALRSYTHWLRSRGILSSTVDSSRDLPVPQPKAKKSKGGRVSYELADFEALYSAIRSRGHLPKGEAGAMWGNGGRLHSETDRAEAVDLRRSGLPFGEVCARFNVPPATLGYWLKRADAPRAGPTLDAQAVRDVLLVRALTGLHYSEIARIAKDPKAVRRVEQGEIKAVVAVKHKSGDLHLQSLDGRALAAVLRLQKAGTVPDKKYIHRAMDEAAALLGLSKMRPGQLRHSFVTWAGAVGRLVKPSDAGVPLTVIARIVGHKTANTTSKFYDDTQIPPMIVLPLALKNDEDPVESGAAGTAGGKLTLVAG